MEYAIIEWKQGNIEKAREIFQRGVNVQEKRIHLPLLEAWFQMENELQNHGEVSRIEKKLKRIESIQNKSSIETSSDSADLEDLDKRIL